MLKRLFITGIAAALSLACVSNGSGQLQRTQRPAQRPAAPATAKPAARAVHIDAKLGDAFPDDTFMYGEIGDLASVVEQLGGASYVYSLLRQALLSTGSGPTNSKLPLTEAQFRGLLGCSIGFGILLPPGARLANDKMRPNVAGVIRTPSVEVRDTVMAFMVEAVKSNTARANAKPRTSTIAGFTVTTIPDPKPEDSFSYTTVGNDIVVGDPKGITVFLNGLSSPASKRLRDVPGYATANARVPGNRVLFAYLNGGPLVRAFNEGVDGYTTTANGKPSATSDLTKALIGIGAIRGGSFSAVAEGSSMAFQVAVELDRSKMGLISLLSDPPPISARASALLPEQADLVTFQSLDLVKIWDFLLAIFTPERIKAVGGGPADLASMFEKMTGVKLRDGLLSSLGTEFVFSTTMVQNNESVTMSNVALQDDTPPPPAPSKPKVDYKFVGLLEVRNPEVVTQCLKAVFSSETDQVKNETIDGVEVWTCSTVAWAYVEGFCLIGSTPDVLQTLADIRDRKTLGSTAAFGAAAGTLPNNAISAAFLSPEFFEYAAKEAEVEKQMPDATIAFPNGLFIAIQKDSDGVYTNFQVPLPNLRLLLEKEKAMAGIGRR